MGPEVSSAWVQGNRRSTQEEKEGGGAERFECPCGEVWRVELEPDTGVLAARFQLVRDRLPEKVLEVLQKDARFVWDWERDEPVPPVE